MDINCEACGKANRGGSRYCVRCGAPLGERPDASSSEAPAEGASPPETASEGQTQEPPLCTSFGESREIRSREEASEGMTVHVREAPVEPGSEGFPLGYVPSALKATSPEASTPSSPDSVAAQVEEPPVGAAVVMPSFLEERKGRGFPLRSLLIASGIVALAAILAVVLILVLPGESGQEKAGIPDLSGMSVEEAGARLEELGFKVGEVSYREAADVPPGTVVSTVPGAGSELEKGASVDLVVAAEPQQEMAESGGKTTCPECFGRGYVTCPRCQGRVYLSDGSICGLCGGKREVPCPTCGGTGYVQR